MAGKIEILKLDVDIEAVIKSTAKMKDNADALKKQYDELRKSTDASTEEIVRAKGAYDNANKEYRNSQREIEKLTNLQGKQIKTIEQGRNALAVISKEWAKQADLYGVNSKEADQLAKKKAMLTDRLKEMESQTGDSRRNVGNYGDALGQAAGQSMIFQEAQEIMNSALSLGKPLWLFLKAQLIGIKANYVAATAGTKGFTAAQKAAAIATNLGSAALKLFKIALVSTGIGAIVVILGSLVAMFTRTQKGIDMINQALAYLGAAVDAIVDRFAKFGGALASIFSGDIAGGLKGMKTAFSGLGDEIQREVDLAVKLEKVLQEVKKAEINLDIRRAAANSRLKELKLLTDDTTRSTEARIESAQKYMKIERDLAAEEIKNQERRVADLLGFTEVTEEAREAIRKIGQEGVTLDQLGISESTVEDMEAFKEEAVKLYDLQAQSFERQTEQQNKLNTLVDQQRKKEEEAKKVRIAAAEAATDAAIKESKTRLQIYIEENKDKADNLKESLKFEEQVRDDKLAILKEELQAKKLSHSEYELAVLQTKNEFLEKQKNLTLEHAQEELEIFKNQHQSRIDENQILTDQIVAEEKRRLDLVAQQEREYQEKRLLEGVISREEYNAAIDAIDKQNKADKQAQEDILKEQKTEREAIDYENRMAAEEGNFLAQLDLKEQRMKKRHALEMAEAIKNGQDIKALEKAQSNELKAIDKQRMDFKTEIASQTLGNLVTILGKESAAGKAVAVAQTTIDTYKAATAAYSAMAGIPVVGPALGAIAAGAAVASGLQSVRKITSTKKPDIPKAARGITLQGRSHAAGGERLYDEGGNPVVEAEGGENIYVINKRASQLINGLDAVNQATGGIPLTQSASYAAAGGMLKTSMARNAQVKVEPINYDLLAYKLSEANRSLPTPVISTEEINRSQTQLKRVVDGAII